MIGIYISIWSMIIGGEAPPPPPFSDHLLKADGFAITQADGFLLMISE